MYILTECLKYIHRHVFTIQVKHYKLYFVNILSINRFLGHVRIVYLSTAIPTSPCPLTYYWCAITSPCVMFIENCSHANKKLICQKSVCTNKNGMKSVLTRVEYKV